MSETVIEKRIAVVICVYNHGKTVAEVVRRVLQTPFRNVVVVDDGSTDCDLKTVLAGLPLILLHHAENQGKGAALLTALRYLESGGNTDWMITLDADGQHDPADLETIVSALAENTLVIGRRQFRENVPAASKIGLACSNFWIRLSTGCVVADSQSGFRAYPVHKIIKLPCRSRHYDWESEILVRAIRSGMCIREVPVRVHYPLKGERISHFRVIRDLLRICRIHFILLFK